jgi:hypothetical protein
VRRTDMDQNEVFAKIWEAYETGELISACAWCGLRGPETRSSSLRCGFVFADEATEQVSAPNVVEVDVGL